jgi:hypothetical protein
MKREHGNKISHLMARKQRLWKVFLYISNNVSQS